VIEQAIDLRFDIRNALQPLGDQDRILEYLSEAEALAASLGDERRLGWVASHLTERYRIRGDTDRAADAGRRALDTAERLGDLAMQVVTNLSLGLLYRTLAEYRRAIEFLRWNIARLHGDLLHERFGLFGLPSVFSRTFSVLCLAELGEFAEGAVLGEESLRLVEAVDQPFSRVYAYLGVGALHLSKGELPQAIDLLENSVAIARATDIPVGFVYAASLLGYSLVLAGRLAEGLPLLQEAVDQSTRMELMAGRSVAVAYLGEAYLLSDRVTDAVAAAHQALQLALDNHERGNEAYARRIMAEVAAARDDLSTAAMRYLDALALGEGLGMRPFQAHCHWGLARVLRRAGQRATAESHLRTARELFSNMEMLYWEERLAGECAKTG
jgi:tetratricopeptide (TPR) repeat protein